MKLPHKTFYFIANETISCGLIKSQLLLPITQQGLDKHIEVVNIVHPLAKIKRQPGCTIIPLGIPARLYQFRLGGVLEMLVALYYAVILYLIVPKNSTIIARNYYSGLSVCILKRVKHIYLVFDPRSQFIQENIGPHKLNECSVALKFWQRMEKKILSASTKVIAVSKSQAEYYRKQVQELPLEVVPCFGQPEYGYITDSEITLFRKKMGFLVNDLIICYYGSLDNKWNNIELYKSYFYRWIEAGYKICVLSQNADRLASDPKLTSSVAYISKVDTPEAAKRLMSACDYGVIIMNKSPDWESRLGVKFVEYLCCGLQVIVGRWVGEAVRIANQHFLNESYIIEGLESVASMPTLNKINTNERLGIARRAESLFGYKNIYKIL